MTPGYKCVYVCVCSTDKKPDVTVHKTSQGGTSAGVGADLHDIYKRLQKGEHDIPLSGLRGLTPERTHTPSE